ncbi:MAG: sigma-70 family RNA polymerase sigma factor [Bacteroidales bacterium]|nr:sigma-70 family RNA polymerase sigma factor [Bacteroidales bacterium]
MQLSIKGDRVAQKAIFDALAPKMMAVCLRYMGDRESAEDVLQDGFVTLFSKLDTYTGEGSFEGWARKIFVNTALMSLRKKDALRDSGDLESVSGRASEAASQLQTIGYKELMGLVAELPPMYRTAFNLFAVEGYSHKEIAEALGITEVTSRSHVQRARAYLQERIKKL